MTKRYVPIHALGVPEECCPLPIPAPVHEASEAVIRDAAEIGYRLSGSATGMLQVLPTPAPADWKRAAAEAEFRGLPGLNDGPMKILNDEIGHERYRWWHVENAGARD